MHIHSASLSMNYSGHVAVRHGPEAAAASASGGQASLETESPQSVPRASDADQVDQVDQENADQSVSPSTRSSLTLTVDEQRQVELLKQRDQEVRAHEQAHAAAGGAYVTSGPSYDYQAGPDGHRYAIGGEVGIDTAPISGDPSATLEKARTLLRAALAPAEPSTQDQRVAAAAKSMAVEAQRELSVQQTQALSQADPRASDVAGSTTSQPPEAPGVASGQQPEQTNPTAAEPLRDRLAQRIDNLFAMADTDARLSLLA